MVFNVQIVLWVYNDYFFILCCIYFEKKTVPSLVILCNLHFLSHALMPKHHFYSLFGPDIRVAKILIVNTCSMVLLYEKLDESHPKCIDITAESHSIV